MITLTTERLTLAPHRREDFTDLCTLWSDPDVVRFIGGRPATEEECWARLLRYAGLWSLLGYGYWAVRETATGRYVGDVGFADFRREIEPPFGDALEAGWALMPGFQGRGLAREAITAALRWADRSCSAQRAVCMIDPANGASIRLAQAMGFEERGRAQYKGSPTLLFERR